MNPTEAERIARSKVLAMLPAEGKASWTELETKAREIGMSLRTLRKNLDKCEKAGLVVRLVDTQARPPRVYYRLNSDSKMVLTRRFPPPGAIRDPEYLEIWLRFNTVLMSLTTILLLERVYEENKLDESLTIQFEETVFQRFKEMAESIQASSSLAKPVLKRLYQEQLNDFKEAGKQIIRYAGKRFGVSKEKIEEMLQTLEKED